MNGFEISEGLCFVSAAMRLTNLGALDQERFGGDHQRRLARARAQELDAVPSQHQGFESIVFVADVSD